LNPALFRLGPPISRRSRPALWPWPTGQPPPPGSPVHAARHCMRPTAGGRCRPPRAAHRCTSPPSPSFSLIHVDTHLGPPSSTPTTRFKRAPPDAAAPVFPSLRSPFEVYHEHPSPSLGLSSTSVAEPPLPLIVFQAAAATSSPPSVSSAVPPSSTPFGPRLTPGSLHGAPGHHQRCCRHRRSSPSSERRRPHPPRHRPTVGVRISSLHLARPPPRGAPVVVVKTSSTRRPPVSRAG
jgi:hypothetical protein